MKRSVSKLVHAARLRLRTGAVSSRSENVAVVDRLGRDLERIPLLVRDIWGRHSESVLSRLREQQNLARQLVQRWEAAELRLIAVANSLASHSGQRAVAMGVPLLASQCLGYSVLAHAYTSHPKDYMLVTPSGVKTQKATPYAIDLLAPQRVILAALRALLAEIALAARAAFLGALFLPAIVSSPALYCGEKARAIWLRLLRGTLARAGPAFIKWAQWAATRPDLFPADACAELAMLQAGAPEHSWAATRAAVESSFGVPLETLFDKFECRPVASGSIAQVHRAVLSSEGARLAMGVSGERRGCAEATGHQELAGEAVNCRGDTMEDDSTRNLDPEKRNTMTKASQLHSNHDAFSTLPLAVQRRARASFAPGATVAVKVRHPAVTGLIERDIALLRRAACLVELFGLGGQLRESVMQFGGPLREQLDLSMEAAHLRRFARNFSGWRGVRFPLPAGPRLVAPEALVETFEEGELISRYISAHDETSRSGTTPVGLDWVKRRLAGLGLACYLKMLLRDNFLHADMHPGNILVALEDASNSFSGIQSDRVAALLSSARSKLLTLAGFDARVPRLVLLDVGMTAALTERDQMQLVDFFRQLTRMDGRAVADAVMGFADDPTPEDRAEGFRRDLGKLFDGLDPQALRANTSAVVAELMESIRRHGVQLEGVVTTVIITTCVLEGWSTKLDPGIRIMESLRDILPQKWDERAARALDASFGKELTPLSSLAVACA